MDNLVSVKVEEPETIDDLPSEVKNEETEVFEQFNNAEGENEKTLDPYAYLQRPGFSSENFKIEILNMPKFFSFTVSKSIYQVICLDINSNIIFSRISKSFCKNKL